MLYYFDVGHLFLDNNVDIGQLHGQRYLFFSWTHEPAMFLALLSLTSFVSFVKNVSATCRKCIFRLQILYVRQLSL